MRRPFLVAMMLLAAVPARAQLSPFKAAKAEALLRTRLACLGCHSLDGSGGRIGPELSAVGSRRSPAYIRAILSDPAGTAPGSIMPRVPMDSSTRALLVGYLGARVGSSGAGPPVPMRAPPRAPPLGRGPRSVSALYQAYCAPCHGAAGRGDGYNGPFLPDSPTAHTNAREMAEHSDDMLYDAIAGGGYVIGEGARMPPFGQTLSIAEMRELVAYIRRLCGCRPPPWARSGGSEP